MLAAAASVTAMAGGCGDDDFVGPPDLTPPLDLSGTAPLDLEAVCAFGCTGCDGGQACYGGQLGDGGAQISAVCLTLCTTTSDCPSGMKCVEPSSGATLQCMNDNLPMSCGTFTIPTCSVANRCIDAQTLGRQFYSANLTVCGIEHVHCPNGCVRVAGDGGEVDGGTPACAP